MSHLAYKGELLEINEAHPGEVTQRLHRALTDIQYARSPDVYSWTLEVA